MSELTRFVLLLATVLFVASCGIKGPLTLPEKQATTTIIKLTESV